MSKGLKRLWQAFIAGFKNARDGRDRLPNSAAQQKQKKLAKEAWFLFRGGNKHSFHSIRSVDINQWITEIFRDNKTRSQFYNWSPSEFKLTKKEQKLSRAKYRELYIKTYNEELFNIGYEDLNRVRCIVNREWFNTFQRNSYSELYDCNTT